VGGGAVLGTIVGAIAGGAIRVAKSGKGITFPAETIPTFKLQEPLTVVTAEGSGGDARTPARQ
jgi:hypothetical protein